MRGAIACCPDALPRMLAADGAAAEAEEGWDCAAYVHALARRERARRARAAAPPPAAYTERCAALDDVVAAHANAHPRLAGHVEGGLWAAPPAAAAAAAARLAEKRRCFLAALAAALPPGGGGGVLEVGSFDARRRAARGGSSGALSALARPQVGFNAGHSAAMVLESFRARVASRRG